MNGQISQKTYEIMRESGISLPTRRTLNDYTHWTSTRPGFSVAKGIIVRMFKFG